LKIVYIFFFFLLNDKEEQFDSELIYRIRIAYLRYYIKEYEDKTYECKIKPDRYDNQIDRNYEYGRFEFRYSYYIEKEKTYRYKYEKYKKKKIKDELKNK